MERDRNFAREVEERSGQNIRLCFQCQKCFAGCPVLEYGDYTPNGIIRLVQYGEKEKVLSSKAVWFCVSCMTCGARCPNEIDMSAVMDTLREMSIEAGLAHEADRRVVVLHEEFIRSIKMWGRIHEVSFFVPYMLRSMDLFGNIASGILLMARGKFPLLPEQIEGIDEIRDMFEKAYKTKGQLTGKA